MYFNDFGKEGVFLFKVISYYVQDGIKFIVGISRKSVTSNGYQIRSGRAGTGPSTRMSHRMHERIRSMKLAVIKHRSTGNEIVHFPPSPHACYIISSIIKKRELKRWYRLPSESFPYVMHPCNRLFGLTLMQWRKLTSIVSNAEGWLPTKASIDI